ncbi:MAG: cytochrome c3 family protein [Chloroflexi bacterium]|nr:cytochrome c3 family protein [Chloroflexota bacterium]
MTIAKRRLIGTLCGIGITLIVTGIYMLMVTVTYAQSAGETPVATAAAVEPGLTVVPGEHPRIYDINGEPITPTGDNSYCLVCHSRPWKSVSLQDGSIINLYVDPSTIAASVHGTSSSVGALGCVDCHGENSFPHSGLTPTDERTYTLRTVQLCVGCHVEEAADLESGLHEEAIRAGNPNAALCTDCHGAHNIQPVVEQSELIAGVCGECHVSTLVEWRSSAHVDIGPLGCATCHSQHSQRIRAGSTADGLCLNCHNEMPDQWVHQQHASNDYPVGCTDCHMYVPDHGEDSTIKVALDPGVLPTGHTMTLTSLPCNTCHEQLMVDGTWAQLGGDTIALQAERDELVTQVTELQLELESAPEAEQGDFVPLIQGLMLGLGFGVTFAAVFIARGSSRTPVELAEESSHVVPDVPAPEAEPASSTETPSEERPNSDEEVS